MISGSAKLTEAERESTGGAGGVGVGGGATARDRGRLWPGDVAGYTSAFNEGKEARLQLKLAPCGSVYRTRPCVVLPGANGDGRD